MIEPYDNKKQEMSIDQRIEELSEELNLPKKAIIRSYVQLYECLMMTDKKLGRLVSNQEDQLYYDKKALDILEKRIRT